MTCEVRDYYYLYSQERRLRIIELVDISQGLRANEWSVHLCHLGMFFLHGPYPVSALSHGLPIKHR